MNLLPIPGRARRAAPAAAARPPRAAPAAEPAAEPADEADASARCGWFDSSHELRCGLVVTELEQPEAVARVVPLSWWLQWQLRA
jgi:hypothetical protein